MKKYSKSLITITALQTVLVLIMVFVPIYVNAGLIACDGPKGAEGVAEGRECNFDTLMVTFDNIITELVKVGIGFSAIGLATAGWFLLTNRGDPGRITTARSIATNVVIGFVILLSAYLIVKVLFGVLGVRTGFNPFSDSKAF